MDPDRFCECWAQGIPIVVSDVQMADSGPEYFMKHYPHLKIDAEDCESGEKMPRKPSVAEFFPDFGRALYSNGTWKLKVCFLRSVSRYHAMLYRTGLHKHCSVLSSKICSWHS